MLCFETIGQDYCLDSSKEGPLSIFEMAEAFLSFVAGEYALRYLYATSSRASMPMKSDKGEEAGPHSDLAVCTLEM